MEMMQWMTEHLEASPEELLNIEFKRIVAISGAYNSPDSLAKSTYLARIEVGTFHIYLNAQLNDIAVPGTFFL